MKLRGRSARGFVRPILRAPIRFDAQGGEPVHAPMVLAAVGALHVRLVLDTGSDVHLLTRELAQRAGIALGEVDPGTDHGGAPIDSWTAGDVSIRLPDSTAPDLDLPLHDAVVIPAPGAWERHGIGGIVSPQRLHATAYAVLDLVADELHLLDAEASAVRTWLLDRRAAPEIMALAPVTGERLPIVSAAVAPGPPVHVLLNTGGRHTEFEPGAVPALVGGGVPEEIGRGVSGAAVMGVNAGAQRLVIDGRDVALPAVMLREGMAEPAGMVGIDVLRGTVLAVGPDPSTPVLWQAPTAERADSGV